MVACHFNQSHKLNIIMACFSFTSNNSLAYQHEFTSGCTKKYMQANMYISAFNIQDSGQ